MSGSGAWDGYGSPPWDPADPVPDPDDTQAIPGLGSIRGPADPPGYVGEPTWPPPGSRPERRPDQQRTGWGDPRSGQPRGTFDSARGDPGVAGWNAGTGWNASTASPDAGARNGSPGNYGPENGSPGNYGPGNNGSGNYAPGNSHPGNSSPGNNGSGNYGPGNYPPGNNGSGSNGSGNYAPGNSRPGNYAPGSNGSGPYGPGNYAPVDGKLGGNGSGGNGPGNYGPGNDGSRYDAPGTGGSTDGSSSDNGGRGRSAGDGRATAAHAFRRNAGPGPGPRLRRRRRSFWRELPVLVVVAIVLAVVIKTFAIQAFFIPSGSMQNTLALYDRVLINKVVYHLRPIHRGDIVVFDGTGSWDFDNPQASSSVFSKVADDLEGVVGITHDSSIYIKRVIGLPGDRVACCNSRGQVTVNGIALSESSYLYPGNEPSTQSFHITVPAGRLWVMGDHRGISYDSRGHMGDPGGGTIPESGVLGRAFVIIWPPSQWGFLNIPATFEQPKLNASVGAGSNAAAGGSSAALLAAMDNGTPARPARSALPLALGFIGAVPLTWLQRTLRLRRKNRRARPAS